MKPDQERVNNLLRDTVTLLCKNGLTYTDELRVEALIGVTVDSNDVFLVHINERFGPGGEAKTSTGAATEFNSDNSSNIRDTSSYNQSPSNSGASSTREGLLLNNTGQSHQHQQSPAHSAQTQRTGSADSVASPSGGGTWVRDRSSTASTSDNAQIDLTKVKLEAVDNEDECVVVRSPQAVARQANMVAGQRRVLNRSASLSQQRHQHISLSQDDTHAMRQQYSIGGGDAGSAYLEYDPDSGEPPLKKRQAVDDGDEDVASYYGGGDSSSNPGSGLESSGQAQWPNIADLAAQQVHQTFQDATGGGGGGGTGDGQLSEGSNSLLPGCSSWPAVPGGSQRGLISGGDVTGSRPDHPGFPKREATTSSSSPHQSVHGGSTLQTTNLPGEDKTSAISAMFDRNPAAEKLHTCQYCGKGFSKGNDLRRHTRIHTGERPYKCRFCGRGFTQSYNLKKHEGTCKLGKILQAGPTKEEEELFHE